MSYQHNIFQGPVAWVTFQSAHMPASPPPPHHFGESRLRGHLWNVSTLTMISSFELSLLPLLWPHVNMCPRVHSLWSTKKQSQREIISSTAPFQSLGSGVHRNSCLWRTHSLATGRSLYSLNLVIKGENGRAKQGGKAQLWILQAREYSSRGELQGRTLPIQSCNLLPKSLLWALGTLPALSAHAGSLSYQPDLSPKSDLGFNLCPSFESSSLSHRVQSTKSWALAENDFKTLVCPILLQKHLHRSLHLHILSLLSGCFPSVTSPNFLFIVIFTPTQWSACLCSPSYLLYLNFLHLGLISNELPSQNSSAKAFTWKRPSKTEK